MKITFIYAYEKGEIWSTPLSIINEFKTPLNINLVDTYSDSILMEENTVNWVPTLVIEDKNGKHKFEGPNEVKEVLRKLVL